MASKHITHGAWILVCDGRKALFMRQDGTLDAPKFSVQHVMEDGDNPRSSAQGADRPVLNRPGAGSGATSVGGPDWHDLREKDFARATADGLARLAAENSIAHVVLVAPPRTLAVLRAALPAALQQAVVAEVAADYVKHPVSEIARLLTRD
jgi:protein required for attachment to host cells